MKLNKPQAEVLLHYMIEAAKVAIDDRECRSDYSGMYEVKFLEQAETFLHEINELSE